MKISPVPSLTEAVSHADPQASKIANIRALKMATNANPTAIPEETAAQELTISDDNSNKVEPSPAVEATQPISPQFAALAKQRRALQVKERELLDKEKALLAQTQGSADLIPKARLKSETLRVLQEAGVTYDDLTQAILANQSNPEVHALRSELNAIKEGVNKQFTERDQQAKQQVLSEMRSEATRLVSNSEDFELTRETGSVPQVMKLIERTYDETGEVLDVPEALRLVEEELFNRQQKLVNLKKMQGLLNKPAEQAQVTTQQRPQGMRTLTNKDTASIPLSAKARAIAAFNGTLKK